VLVLVNKSKKRCGEILFVDSQPLVRNYLVGSLTPDLVHNIIINVVYNWVTVSRVAEIMSNIDVARTGYILAPELHCSAPSKIRWYRR
jgi:hypothetical protein